MPTDKAVVLLSGGLDSATALAVAEQDFDVHALTISYGQLHTVELEAAKRIVATREVRKHLVYELDLRTLCASALTRADIEVPKARSLEEISKESLPPTYVPARNTIMLSLALAWAETIGARDLFIGVNVLDASGYPDCRRPYIEAFEKTANLGSSAAYGGRPVKIHMPLVALTKAEIITLGQSLGIDYGMTHSCYEPVGDLACGNCDACQLRRKGFDDAGVADPTRYV